jgi:hypothetical protein
MPITAPILGQATQQVANAATLDPNQLAQANATTLSGQAGNIIGQGGQLMQQAATIGNSMAAQRGLLNSSMGIQAAQNSVLQNATQLAQGDMNALNQANQFNVQAANQAMLQNQANQQRTNEFNAQQGNAMDTWNLGQQNESVLRTLDANNKEALMNIEANYKTLMQANSSASGMYEQMLKNLSDIQTNKDMDATAKQTAVQNQLTYLRTGMTMIQNMNSITGLVTF